LIEFKEVPDPRENRNYYKKIEIVVKDRLEDIFIFTSKTDDNFYFPENWLRNHVGKPAKGGYVLRNMNDAIENYNVVASGTLILDKHIKFNNDKEGLTPETAANIRRLLGSSDLETFKLGFSLLFNHDYEKEKDLFFLCLASANTHCWYRREKTILSRNIISKIKFDFPNSKF
jgi:hypothetical protein